METLKDGILGICSAGWADNVKLAGCGEKKRSWLKTGVCGRILSSSVGNILYLDHLKNYLLFHRETERHIWLVGWMKGKSVFAL